MQSSVPPVRDVGTGHPLPWQEVAQLLHAVGNVPAYDLEGLLRVIAAQLAALVEATDCVLMVTVRQTDLPADDALGGWRVREARVPHGDADAQAMIDAFAQAETYTTDAPSIAVVRGAGTVRAALRSDMANAEEWRTSSSTALHEARGIGDHMIGACPATDDIEFMAMPSRGPDDAPFTAADRDALAHAMGHLDRSARRIALSFGAPGRLLSPRERETLSWLLQGHSEKQIAHEMRLAKSTVHEYVVGVYRKVGVSSRAELMARWLGA